MPKNKNRARVLTNDAEIDAAIAAANEYEPFRPKLASARYNVEDETLALDLATGLRLIVPRALLPAIRDATPEEAASLEVVLDSAVHWPKLDDGFDLQEFLDDVSGAHARVVLGGKRGGPARTPKKAAAARRNGRKGGRPRRTA